MQVNQCSQTSIVTAFARAYHARHDQPVIFDDVSGGELLTPEQLILLEELLISGYRAMQSGSMNSHTSREQMIAEMVRSHLPTSLFIARARYTEECLFQLIERGCDQYVILGAGLDTFVFRHPAIAQRIHVYEVDHPATQQFKLSRIKALGWSIPATVRYVQLDFELSQLMDALILSAFEPGRPALFSWSGGTYYLAQTKFQEVLTNIAGQATGNSTIIFDFLEDIALTEQCQSVGIMMLRELAASVGEPLLSAHAPPQLANTLRHCGWVLTEMLGPQQIQSRYLAVPSSGYRAYEHCFLARAEVSGRHHE
jgi:methyltransferase (TIGR00027 family)